MSAVVRRIPEIFWGLLAVVALSFMAVAAFAHPNPTDSELLALLHWKKNVLKASPTVTTLEWHIDETIDILEEHKPDTALRTRTD